MSRIAAPRYDERIKSHISPPKRPTLQLFSAIGGDGAMSRDRGAAALFPKRSRVPRPRDRLKGTVATKESLSKAKNCPRPEPEESC
jgi:hypothetical protein